MLKLSLNFKEIILLAHADFGEKNKILEAFHKLLLISKLLLPHITSIIILYNYVSNKASSRNALRKNMWK
jgi:hypothetical protein